MAMDTAATLHQALDAGFFGQPFPKDLSRKLATGALDHPLDGLGFDSLAWMEFCISVELNTGMELTPVMITEMRTLADIADWLNEGGPEV